jgi:thymidylate synthase ThyX
VTDPQTGELRFDRKPHRMTSPPANDRLWLEGYEGTKCRLELDPIKAAVLCREATWGSVYDYEPTPEQIAETWKEIESGKVLSAALSMPAFCFVMRGSRATMDQLLRLREAAGASHTTRDNDFRDFNIIVPSTIARMNWPVEDPTGPVDYNAKEMRDGALYDRVAEHVERTRELYGELVDAGVPPQDARYVALPMGYQGDWIQVMNLQALIKECEHRMCNGLSQHETNYMARLQRDLVVEQFPAMEPLLKSRCEKTGGCSRGTMLFPTCGAFGQFQDPHTPDSVRVAADDCLAIDISRMKYEDEPERYLYPPEQNDAMMFAEWDRKRKVMEAEGYGIIRYATEPLREHYHRQCPQCGNNSYSHPSLTPGSFRHELWCSPSPAPVPFRPQGSVFA